jgi:diguanylate cyclase (GGDEF)-like protein
LRISAWLAPTNAVVAASMAAPTVVYPWLGLLSALPLMGFWGVMQGYGQLSQRYRDLSDLHGFVGRVGRSLDLDEIVHGAATEVAALLRAARAGIVVFDQRGDARRADIGSPLPLLPTVPTDPAWAAVFAAGVPTELVLQADGPLAELAAIGNVIAAPVGDGESMVGLIVVANARAPPPFRNNGLVRLGTVAEQFAPNLRKACCTSASTSRRHDSLTGLPSRSRSSASSTPNWRRCTSPTTPGRSGVDGPRRFKEVNDTLGHHAGDTVLADFAGRLSMLRPADLLARLAGDEFALLAMRTDQAEISALAGQLVEAARRPFTIDGLEVVVTMSIGVAPATLPASDANTLLRRADIAMYTAKHRHTGFELYREEIDRRTPPAWRCSAICATRSRPGTCRCSSNPSSISAAAW